MNREGLVDYPFPLRENCIAHLYLPARLSLNDVERISRYMRSLVLEETGAHGPDTARHEYGIYSPEVERDLSENYKP